MLLKKKIPLFVFLFILLVSAVRICMDFPGTEDYAIGADEGTYFHQAQILHEHGLEGFRTIMKEYINNDDQHVFPTPLRILHIGFASLAIAFHNSISALAGLSLFWFIALCLISWYFIKRLWDDQTAFVACLLLSFSPLLSGMARRALMDSEVAFFSLLTVFLVISYCRDQRRSDGILLILSLTACLLIKESFQLTYAFFPACLFFSYWKGRHLKPINLVLISGLPVLLSLLVYLFVFRGLGDVRQVYTIAGDSNLYHPTPYIVNFNSGPWYQYFIDFFLLSPIVSVLFFLYSGHFLIGGEKKEFAGVALMVYMGWFLLVNAFLHKDVRYATPLDPIYVLFATLCLLKLTDKLAQPAVRNFVLGITITFVVLMEHQSYQKIFIVGKVYDPVSANLLKVEKLIPR
jgi:4-amino-4-deoxy-L-arabinose transferase-like glycosyltransferase